jgi:hypothetical protein
MMNTSDPFTSDPFTSKMLSIIDSFERRGLGFGWQTSILAGLTIRFLRREKTPQQFIDGPLLYLVTREDVSGVIIAALHANKGSAKMQHKVFAQCLKFAEFKFACCVIEMCDGFVLSGEELSEFVNLAYVKEEYCLFLEALRILEEREPPKTKWVIQMARITHEQKIKELKSSEAPHD